MRDDQKKLLHLEQLAQSSEVAAANKMTMTAVTILNAIIAVAYVMEWVKGNRTVGYVAITVLLCVIPVILGWVANNKDPESKIVRHIVSYGFAILYMFVLFTANNVLVFTYVIPMLIVITLYGDIRYIVKIGIGVVVDNIIVIALQLLTTEVSAEAIVSMEIQGLISVIIVAYFIWTSVMSAKFGEIRKARLELERNKTEDLLKDVLDISGKMTGNVSKVATEMETLKSSVDHTLSSMMEVNTGTSESAEAAQNQMTKTAEIKQHIGNVENISSTIDDNVRATSNAILEGQKHINRMDGLTEQVDKAGKDVAEALRSFQNITSRMNSITEMITEVASQTSLLSLNASIEAARAGEAGRGFAVVASEISTLSDQTTQATNDINGLINNISSQLDVMVGTIENLIRVGEEESGCAQETAESFTLITERVEDIQKNASELDLIVKNLAEANGEIMSSVETISAMTEEVTAHANETYTSSEQNQKIVTNINELVEMLNSDAEQLKAHS